MKPMDHRNLDKDISYFSNYPSTVENICIYIWKQIADDVTMAGCKLHKVKVHETENISAVYMGEFGGT